MTEESEENLCEQPAQKSYFEYGLYPRKGDRVRVIRLFSTDNYRVDPRFIETRREDVKGTIIGHVDGNGVELVEHDDTHDIGAYSLVELTPLDIDEILSQFPELQ